MATEFAAPFDSSPISTSQQFRDRQRPTQPDMIDADHGSTAGAVSDGGSGTSVNIQNYRAIVQAGLYELTGGPLNLAVAANGGGSNRFDIVTCRYDASATPKIRTTIIQGTPGAGLPALTNSATGVWDFPIAHFEKTPAGAIVNLRDRRKFSDGVGGIIGNDDTSGPWFPPAPRKGHKITFWPLGDVYQWDGSAWVVLYSTAHARLKRVTSNQSINDAVSVPLQFNGEDKDTHGGHDNSADNSRYASKVPGVYRCTATCPWGLDPDGRREGFFRVNGSTSYNGSSHHVNANTRPITNWSREIPLALNDYVEAVVFQTAGNAIDADRTANDGVTMEITWVRPL